MPEYGVKQEHGGDDDVEHVEETVEKKIKLDKYLYASDTNLTDVFERIIRAYMNNEDVVPLLEKVKHERLALLRAGITTLERGLPHLRISKNRIAYYLVLMNFQMDWLVVFRKLIEDTYDRKTKHSLPLVLGMNAVYNEQEWKQKFNGWISDLIIDLNNEEILSLICEMNNRELILSLKKHLSLIARDDVGENRNNAIRALAELVEEDEEVARVMAALLRRPEEETQTTVLHALLIKRNLKNVELLEEIKKLGKSTKNAVIKNLIKRIVG